MVRGIQPSFTRDLRRSADSISAETQSKIDLAVTAASKVPYSYREWLGLDKQQPRERAYTLARSKAAVCD